MPLTLESVVQRTDDLLVSPVGEDTIMFNAEAGRYYGLDRLGSWVWEQLGAPLTISELCQRLTRDYEVELAQAEQDLLEFLSDLERMQLVQVR